MGERVADHAQLGICLGRAPAFLKIPCGCRHVHLRIQRDPRGKIPLADDSALVSIFHPREWWHSLLQSLAAVVVFPLCTKLTASDCPGCGKCAAEFEIVSAGVRA